MLDEYYYTIKNKFNKLRERSECLDYLFAFIQKMITIITTYPYSLCAIAMVNVDKVPREGAKLFSNTETSQILRLFEKEIPLLGRI